MSQRKYARIALALCIVAAVLYNSWPLGYILNSQTARYGFASTLERAGQPHYQLFVLGDILTGVSLTAVAALALLKLIPLIGAKRYIVASLGGLVLFGLSTALAAILPLLYSAAINRVIGLDGIFSSLSAFGIFISLISLCALGASNYLNTALTRVTQITLLAWSASGLLFVVFALNGGAVHISQQIFLLLTGVAIIVGGLDLNNALRGSTVKL
jgi:hypothetical protein